MHFIRCFQIDFYVSENESNDDPLEIKEESFFEWESINSGKTTDEQFINTQKNTCNKGIKRKIVEEKDEHAIFGEYVASKLRKLSSHIARCTVQHKISDILWEADLGLYDCQQQMVKKLKSTSENVRNDNPMTSNESNIEQAGD